MLFGVTKNVIANRRLIVLRLLIVQLRDHDSTACNNLQVVVSTAGVGLTCAPHTTRTNHISVLDISCTLLIGRSRSRDKTRAFVRGDPMTRL